MPACYLCVLINLSYSFKHFTCNMSYLYRAMGHVYNICISVINTTVHNSD